MEKLECVRKLDTIEFNLFKPIMTGKGECSNLIICSPSLRHQNIVAQLQNMISHAQFKMSESNIIIKQLENQTNKPNESENKDEWHVSDGTKVKSVDGQAIIQILKIGYGLPLTFYADFCKLFKKFITSCGVCHLNDGNKTPLNVGYYDNISYDDGERLMRDYISFFMCG